MSEHDPLTPIELERWTAALRGSFLVTAQFITEFLATSPAAVDRLEAILIFVLERCDEGEIAAGVSKAATLGLPGAARTRVLLRAFTDRRPGVRRAVFEHWTPLRFTVPREGAALLPEPEWSNLLRRALGDTDPRIRSAATGLVFDSDVGASMVPEVLANLDEPDRTLQWLSLLALRSASDPASLQALIRAYQGSDEFLACAAVRALAARPDGQREFQQALADPREQVQGAARFALACGDRRL